MNPYSVTVVQVALELAKLIAEHRDMLDELPPDKTKVGLHDCVKVAAELLQRANELLGQMETQDPSEMPKEVRDLLKMLVKAMEKGDGS